VAERPLFSPDEVGFLRALNDEGVEFLVVGLWFRNLSAPGIMKALKRVGGVSVTPTGSTPPMFSGPAVSLFDIVMTMHGLDSFQKEASRSITVPIDGLRLEVLPLERIIVSKKATNRPKDRAILPVLEDAARAVRTKRRKRECPPHRTTD